MIVEVDEPEATPVPPSADSPPVPESQTPPVSPEAPSEVTLESLAAQVNVIMGELKQLPRFLANSFAEYDKNLMQKLQAGGAGSATGWNGALQLAGQILPSILGPSQTPSAFEEVGKTMFEYFMRSTTRQFARQAGLPDHISVERH